MISDSEDSAFVPLFRLFCAPEDNASKELMRMKESVVSLVVFMMLKVLVSEFV